LIHTTDAITDTRAQKMVSYTSARALQKRCLHMTNIERSKTLSQHFLLFYAWFVYIAHTFFTTQKQY